MIDDYIYTPAVATDVMVTFRRLGWTPASEDPAIVVKWKRYQEIHLRQHVKQPFVFDLPII
jgi:hypothetical protein